MTPPVDPPGAGGSRAPLLVGAFAFAVVFLIIVGGTVGYLVLRTGDGEGTAAPTSSDTESAGGTPGASTTAEPSAAASEERCWYGGEERTSTNPEGRLRGGGLELVAPEVFDGRTADSLADFTSDPQTATAPVEDGWYSTLTVGRVVWQPGVEYPGHEAAAERILSCLTTSTAAWGSVTSGRSVHEQTTTEISVDGMEAFRAEAEMRFGEDELERTDATRIVAIVVDTPEGPSLFLALIAVGVPEHEEALDEAVESLTGLSG